MNRLLLIDGHALMFRMYYAFIRRPMINSKGTDTSVIFGFTKYLLDLIEREKPSHVAVAFDPPCKTFRHEAYPAYKANRSATPDVIKDSLEPLVEIVRSMGIPVLMMPGYEADDVLGSMAKKWGGKGFIVHIASPDKDLGQLISDNVFQLKPGKNGENDELIDKAAICERFNIQDPSQIIDILAIWGDTADNVQGVKGIGEIGAKKLVSRYGNIDGIMTHLDELPPKQAAAIKDAADTLAMSRFLVTIKTDADPGCTEEDLRLHIANPNATRKLLSEHECFSLLKMLPVQQQAEEDLPDNLFDYGQQELFEQKTNLPVFSIVDWDTFEAFAMKNGETGITIPAALEVKTEPTVFLSTKSDKNDIAVCILQTPETAAALLESEQVRKIGYNLKQYINFLRHRSIHLNGHLADIELMHYLINPETSHKLEIIASSYLNIDIETFYNTRAQQTDSKNESEPNLFSSTADFGNTAEDFRNRYSLETALLLPLCEAIEKDFAKDESLHKLYDEIECPLIRVLSDMETCGFKIDTAMLEEFGKTLRIELESIENKIRKTTGEPTLNISSPMQLGNVLFDKMKLDPKVKKNKRGNYPTDEETLSELKDKHPIIRDILHFREIKKLLSTYIDPFPSLIDPTDGKIHTTFNQSLTATGRLSSVKPNLQNIPIRTELGREIRKAFIASAPDRVIISADYSQVELRVMASVSGDEHFIEAFRQGRDIHTATAAKVFKVKEEDVTTEQRRQAKTANFGIIYGISAFGLSQRLDIPRKEAKELIDEYFHNYPAISGYIENTISQARANGYVETLLGRKRYIKDINSKNAIVRGFAERNAINAPIQGTSADIIKIAMNNISAALKSRNMSTKMILQVHDELVFDAPISEKDEVLKIIKTEMESVLKLSVPLIAECNFGSNWLEAH